MAGGGPSAPCGLLATGAKSSPAPPRSSETTDLSSVPENTRSHSSPCCSYVTPRMGRLSLTCGLESDRNPCSAALRSTTTCSASGWPASRSSPSSPNLNLLRTGGAIQGGQAHNQVAPIDSGVRRRPPPPPAEGRATRTNHQRRRCSGSAAPAFQALCTAVACRGCSSTAATRRASGRTARAPAALAAAGAAGPWRRPAPRAAGPWCAPNHCASRMASRTALTARVL